MNKLMLKNKKGFTIIEVVLVLAIAGLIFLMVFLALPALQRNQRDLARKNDARNLLAAIMNYKSNNGGRLPTNTNNDAWTKLKSYWEQSGNLSEREATHIDAFNTYLWTQTETIVGYSKTGSGSRKAGDWNIALGTTCSQLDSGGWVLKYGGGNNRNSIAVLVELEGVTTREGWGYCIDTGSMQ